jgi:hypothetical protein
MEFEFYFVEVVFVGGGGCIGEDGCGCFFDECGCDGFDLFFHIGEMGIEPVSGEEEFDGMGEGAFGDLGREAGVVGCEEDIVGIADAGGRSEDRAGEGACAWREQEAECENDIAIGEFGEAYHLYVFVITKAGIS